MKSPYGFGKTLAACSFAVEGPILLMYFDKKQPVELLTFFKKHRPELLDRIEYEVYGAHNAHEYLNKLMSLSKECRYTAVITDSATNLTSAAVNWSLGFRNSKDGAKKDPLNNSAIQMIPDFDEYKVETSLVTQALDLSRSINAHIIWTCHPLPSLKIEGSGKSIKVTKVNNIVTYGSKVGAIIPGNFTEIYHFSLDNSWDDRGNLVISRKVNTVGIGDDFAKSALNLPAEFDITDKLFYEVWRDLVKGGNNDVAAINP